MAKLWSIRFVIEPSQGFNAPASPIDMMRRDRCTPLEQTDATEIACIEIGAEIAPITMVHYEHGNKSWQPTFRRWQSFGWQVTKVEPAREV